MLWFRPLYDSVASTDHARYTSKPFLVFYRLFRRMAHFAIRHLVNEIQGDYQSKGDYLPLLYADYKTLKRWLAGDRLLDTASELLELYWVETVAFWNRFEHLFSFLFSNEWTILLETRNRARAHCAALRKHGLSLSARDVAVHFAAALREVKAEGGYLNDREEVRARFNELVWQVNRRYKRPDCNMTREQILSHLLPYRLTHPLDLRKKAEREAASPS